MEDHGRKWALQDAESAGGKQAVLWYIVRTTQQAD